MTADPDHADGIMLGVALALAFGGGLDVVSRPESAELDGWTW